MPGTGIKPWKLKENKGILKMLIISKRYIRKWSFIFPFFAYFYILFARFCSEFARRNLPVQKIFPIFVPSMRVILGFEVGFVASKIQFYLLS